MPAVAEKPKSVVKAPTPAPSSAGVSQSPQAQAVSLTISIPSFSLDEKAKLKLPLLLILLLFFSFSAFMFEKANFKTVDLFDLSRTAFNVAKLSSVNFILFLVLFSVTVGLALYYGHGLSPLIAALSLPVLLLASLLLGFVYPLLMLAFVGIALAVSAACVSASFVPDLTFKTAWSSTGKAILLLALLAFIVVNGKVSANKQAYEDTFFSTLTGVTYSNSSASNSSASNTTEAGFTKKDLDDSFSTADFRAALLKIPGISSINSSKQDQFANDVKAALFTPVAFERVKAKAATSSAPAASASVSQGRTCSKQELLTVSGVKFLIDNLALLAGLLAGCATLVAGTFVRLLSSIIAASIAKFI